MTLRILTFTLLSLLTLVSNARVFDPDKQQIYTIPEMERIKAGDVIFAKDPARAKYAVKVVTTLNYDLARLSARRDLDMALMVKQGYAIADDNDNTWYVVKGAPDDLENKLRENINRAQKESIRTSKADLQKTLKLSNEQMRTFAQLRSSLIELEKQRNDKKKLLASYRKPYADASDKQKWEMYEKTIKPLNTEVHNLLVKKNQLLDRLKSECGIDAWEYVSRELAGF